MLGSENFAATKVLFVVFVEMFITLLYVVEVPALLPLEEGRAQNESRSKANFPSASQFCACEYTEYTFEFFFYHSSRKHQDWSKITANCRGFYFS